MKGVTAISSLSFAGAREAPSIAVRDRGTIKGRWGRVAGWWPRAIASNLVQIASARLAGTLYDGWLLEQRPWSADGLGTLSARRSGSRHARH
jgi:hypothetical protein